MYLCTCLCSTMYVCVMSSNRHLFPSIKRVHTVALNDVC